MNPSADKQKYTTALHEIAVAALQAHRGNIAKAAPVFANKVRKNRRLVVAMAEIYLQGVSDWDRNRVDNHATHVPSEAASDQIQADDQSAGVAAATSSNARDRWSNDIQHPDVPAPAAADYHVFDIHQGNVPAAGSSSPRKKIPFASKDKLPQRIRTKAEKEAAIAAMTVSAEAVLNKKVNGKRLGYLSWYELRNLIHRNATDAASYLRLGTDATETAILLNKIDLYATVPNESVQVKDVVPVKELQRMQDEARIEAPQLVALGMRRHVETIERRQEMEIGRPIPH